MKTSEILEKAKAFLWDGISHIGLDKEVYICWALREVLPLAPECENDETFRKIRSLQEEIENRLGPGNATLEIWLERKLGEDFIFSKKAIQAHRLAWMNLLIEEYKQKGD